MSTQTMEDALMSKKFFIGLAPLLALAALAVMPVAAQANPPHFTLESKTKLIPAGEPTPVVSWGVLALTNETTGGKVECHNVVGATVENPGSGATGPAGTVKTESFDPYNCKSAACEGAAPGAFITVKAENLPWAGKLENATKAGKPAIRQQSGAPFKENPTTKEGETQPGETKVNVQCQIPGVGVVSEEISEGENRPYAVDGTSNNNHPSFLEFDPESGTLLERKTKEKGKTEETLRDEGYEENNLLLGVEGAGPQI
jgi:hypothetical protein